MRCQRMLLNHDDSLCFSREAFPLTEAQNVQACWSPAVRSSAAFWPTHRKRELRQQSAFDAANSLMSFRCLSEPLMWIWALQQNILMGGKRSRNRLGPVVSILSSNSHINKVKNQILVQRVQPTLKLY